MVPIMTIMVTAPGEITPTTLILIYTTIGDGAVLHLHGGLVAFTEVMDGTTHGDGTDSDTVMAGTTGAGEATVGTTGVGVAMAGTTGAGEATVGAVITTHTFILLTDIIHITIPVIDLETTITIEVTLTTLAEGVYTATIPPLEALL
jgi:hypothetical protein